MHQNRRLRAIGRLATLALALLAPLSAFAAESLSRDQSAATAAVAPKAGAVVRTAADGSQAVDLTTRYTRDRNGNITRTDYPDGSFRTTDYSPTQKPVKECDALLHCVERVYNLRDLESEVRYADGSRATTEYDGNGNIIAKTDRAGRRTQFIYDKANRRTQVVLPDATPASDDDNPRRVTTYDRAGQIVGETNERGKRTNFGYDLAGRVVTIIDPLSHTTRHEYDTSGRRTATIDPNGHRVEFVTDGVGNITETKYQGGSSIKVEYDAVRRPIARTDQDGRRVTFRYDKLGRLVQSTSGRETVAATSYAFDARGNLITQTDAEDRSTRWVYDYGNRPIKRTLPSGNFETMQYDIVGRLVARTDFNGATTRYGFDAVDRRTSIDYPNDPDVTIEYLRGDTVPVKITDGNGTTTIGYGPRGEVLGIEYPHGESIAYEYDAAGNRVELISAFQHLRFVYDDMNRLATVTDDHGTTRYEYDGVGNRTAIVRPNGVRSDYGYDVQNRLVSLTHKTAAGELLFGVTYSLTPAGKRRIAQERDASGIARTVTYTYDDHDRLIGEAVEARDATRNRTLAWTYDKVGNRKTETVTVRGVAITTAYDYDANDRLVSETTGGYVTRYTYDANGNTLTQDGPDGRVEYAYDDADRLVEMRAGGARHTYQYDADGLRIGQTYHPASGPTVSTFYLLDKSGEYAQVIEEHTQEGTGPRRLSAIHTFGDDPIAQTRNGLTQYLLADGMGSTRLLTDAAGAVTDTFVFDAFGNELERTGTTTVTHLYRGEQYDPALAFYYLRARYYDPSTGRFPTMDSFAGFAMDPPSLHKYAYAHADPVNKLDPSGHMTLQELGQTLNTAARQVMSSTGNFRIVFEKTGCLLIENVIEQQITNGIYVFLDAKADGKPYVGQTKNDLDERMKQHSRDGKRLVGAIISKLKVGIRNADDTVGNAGKDELQLIEQLIYDFLVGEEGKPSMSNDNYPLSPDRPSKATLRKRLADIKLCK
ncbi:RHS repeat-associated core domain-containing protein [Chitinimonas lacunae]|uniref:RHS repeat-associated core domain-containing protein n=1 Tax=Chitinimonas lacunae TaxID=1963018 RepID=A0ABV8MTT8_9NEIS